MLLGALTVLLAAVRFSEWTELNAACSDIHRDLRLAVAVGKDFRLLHIAEYHDGGTFFHVRDHFIKLLAPNGYTPPDRLIGIATPGICRYSKRCHLFS